MSINYDDPKVKAALAWIHGELERGATPEQLKDPLKDAGYPLGAFLLSMTLNEGWELTEEEWIQIVDKEFEDHEERIEFEEVQEQTTIISRGEDNNLFVPKHRTSSWQKYRKVLEKKGFDKETIDTIEDDSGLILKKLSLDTSESGPIKGMVVGGVQSGKTTNMAALMAMAADFGWNLFIVLTGMVDNLRVQTQTRLHEELTQTNGEVNWDIVENPSIDGGTDRIPQKLNFRDNQYMIVTLKQKNRLEGLLEWLTSDKAKMRQMKILVIDDEADQASVNTSDLSKEDRRTINKLLVNLVNGRDANGEELEVKYEAMNYIGYTATPYANVLSESVEESLYPRDFVALLKQSPNHWGPQQIFGIEGEENYPGLNIIRNIDTVNNREQAYISAIHEGKSLTLPKGLKDSISYFIAASASLRKHRFGSPVSMLIHTSVRKEHHSNLAQAVVDWIKKDRKSVLQKIEKVWEKERNNFTLEHFIESMPRYEANLTKSLRPHPFVEIREEIDNILDEIAPISSPRRGRYEYHGGLHLCIDNSEYNRIVGEDEHYRLVYPTDEETLSRTPIFLVIGGATLSRGLTLEGLITTYFLRNSGQADTLMQMGRWFGYRIGYELYPRLWMTEHTQEQFNYLADLDFSLRKEIEEINALSKTPSDVGVRIKTAPKASLLKVTSKNKQRGAIESDYDFTGASIQTTIFENDKTIMKENIRLMSNFIDELGMPIIANEDSSPSVFWEKIAFSKIKNFLLDYNFSKRMRLGNNIEAFIEWVEKMTEEDKLDKWNVIAIGKGSLNQPGNNWEQKYFTWNKVERSKQKNEKVEDIRIQSLRAPSDMFKDINLSDIHDPKLLSMIKRGHSSNYLEVRERLGLEATPQMMLYRIDKDSTSQKGSKTREDLNTPYDLAGIYISIPGGRKNEDYVTHLVVSLDDNYLDLDTVDLND